MNEMEHKYYPKKYLLIPQIPISFYAVYHQEQCNQGGQLDEIYRWVSARKM